MGGFSTALKTFLTGDPLQGVKQIIEEFHLSPEQKAQIQAQIDAGQIQREQIADARDEALAELQSANIRAETTSTDAFVRRARPAFLYVIEAALAVNLLFFPLINACLGKGLTFPEIPAPYLELFGAIVLGYTGARTWEKAKGVQ